MAPTPPPSPLLLALAAVRGGGPRHPGGVLDDVGRHAGDPQHHDHRRPDRCGADHVDHGRALGLGRQGALRVRAGRGRLHRPPGHRRRGPRRPTRSQPDANATPRGSNELILRLDCALPHQYEVIAVVPAGLPGEPRRRGPDRGGQAAVPARVRDLRGHAVPELGARGRLGPAERRAAGAGSRRSAAWRSTPPASSPVGSARLGPLSAQRPSKRGGRFSAKAARPSARSALAHARAGRPRCRRPTAGASGSASSSPSFSPVRVNGASSAMRSAQARPSLGGAQPVDEPDRVGPLAAQHVGAQQHVAGRRLPGQGGQAADRPLVDHEAELGRRAPRTRRSGWRCGGRRRWRAGCRRPGRTLDHGHGRAAEPPEAAEHPAQAGDELVVLDGAQVGAGAEVAVGAGQGQHPDVVVGRLRQGGLEPGEGLVVEGAAALGPVDGDDEDRGRGGWWRSSRRP